MTVAATSSIARTVDGMTDFAARLERTSGMGRMGDSAGMTSSLSHPVFLSALYRHNWLARRVVDCVADDMGRDGIDLSIPGDDHAVEAFQNAEKETCLWTSITDGIRWGRLHGGAIAVTLIDGQDLSTPMNAATVGRGQFKGFHIFDRWEVLPSDERITTLGRDFGLPEFYLIQETGLRIHHSRVIRFLGSPISNADRNRERYWSASVLEKVVNEVVQVKDSAAGVAKLLRTAYLRTISVKDYRKMIAMGGDVEDMMLKHFTGIARMQDIMSMTILDAEDRFFTNSYSFGGIRDVQESQLQQVSGASGIPMIRLCGKSDGGLNANGETTERSYYDEVMREMERDLRPPLDRVIPVIMQSALGGIPADWSFSFRPLYQMKAAEKASVVATEVDTVVKLYDSGIFDRERAIREAMEIGKRHERFPQLDDKAMKEILNDAPEYKPEEFSMEQTANGEEENEQSSRLLAE